MKAGAVTSGVSELIRDVPQRFERGVKLSTLKDWPGNPKDHDIGLIIESITRNGAYGVVLAQQSTRRILSGHGRKIAFRKLGIARRDVLWLDVDNATAERIVTIENRAVERGGWNEPALYDWLRDMAEHDNLAGSGYDGDDVEAMRRAIDMAAADDAAAARVAARDAEPPGSDAGAAGFTDTQRFDWWFARGLQDSVCEGSVDLWWSDEEDGDAVERVTHGTNIRHAMDRAMRGEYDG